MRVDESVAEEGSGGAEAPRSLGCRSCRIVASLSAWLSEGFTTLMIRADNDTGSKRTKQSNRTCNYPCPRHFSRDALFLPSAYLIVRYSRPFPVALLYLLNRSIVVFAHKMVRRARSAVGERTHRRSPSLAQSAEVK